MRKLVLFAAILAILGAYGCNEDNVYNPDVNTDGRVIGTIQGVVTDGADGTLLPGIVVSTTVRGASVSTVTDASGHYAFTNLDPGAYIVTFEESAKAIGDAHTTMIGHTEIPTLEDLSGIMDVPTDADFPYEVEANMEMFPLTGTAEGYVYVMTDGQTMVPAEGCQVVADFLDPGVNTSHDWWGIQISGNEWTATCDEMGHYSFTGLPAGAQGELRTLPYTYNDMTFDPQDATLDLRGGSVVADPFYFNAISVINITSMNWNDNVPFPVDGSFIATFSVPMDPATFTATLYSYSKALVPVTVSWEGNTVTIDPVNDLESGTNYTLTLAGWTADGVAYPQRSFNVFTSDDVPPAIVFSNFEGSQTFPIDGNLEFTFNMPMDPSSVVVWFDEDKLGDIVFNSSWNEGNTMLTIDPVVDLDYGMGYQVRVEGNSADGVTMGSPWMSFQTMALQDVIVVDTNFMSDFDHTANLYWTFSEAMDPASFEINMSDGDPIAFADPVWSNGNTTVTIDPYLDLDRGVYYTVTMSGMAASGAGFNYSSTYRTAIGDAPFIVQTNIVDGEFPIDGNIEVQFNKPMDEESVEVNFSGAVDPLFGAITWTDNMNMVFDPDVQLLPSTTYTFNVVGDALDGGHMNTTITFDTIGGIQMVWTNIRQVDGNPITNFPVDSPLQFRFSLPVDLNAPNTSIILYRNFPAQVPVLVHPTLAEDGYLLTVTPDQTMELDTEYNIVMTVGSGLLGDTTNIDITFTTEATPPEPVDVVANFTLDPAWDGNYDETNVTFSWDRDPNAATYNIYARNPGAAKDDFLLVLTVPQQATDTVTATVDLAANSIFQQYFDTRDTDTPQTPFDGRDVIFKITAVNGLGEGSDSGEFAVSDVYAPSGAFTGQDVSADDSAAPDGADNIVVVSFDADEYLDSSYTPVVTVTENDLSANNWGDPNYTPTVGNITYTDMDGYTQIDVEIVVADGMNGAGDYVAIDGFYDTSGNMVDVATTPIAPYQLTDGTAPTGTFADPGISADNSLGTDPVDFTMEFTATELLDETVVPTVTITDGGISDMVTYLGTYTYSVVGGVSVVTLDMQIPAGANVRGDFVTMDGLVDLAGNAMDAVVDSDPLVDTTAPGGSWTAQSASADNAGGGADATVTVTFTCPELLDSAVAPTFTITDGGYAGETAVDAANVVFTDVGNTTTVDFDVTIPAGMNAMDDTLSVNGLTDVSGNAQTVAISYALLDQTAPATPAGLTVTSANGDDATGDYSVVLDWTANTEADLASYEVFRDGVSVGTVAAGTETFTDNLTGEAAGNTHDYTLTAIDNAANASVATAAATATLADNVAPAVPAGLTVDSANGDDATGVYDVVLSWTASTESDLGGYDVYRGGVLLATVAAGTETYTDAGVPGAVDGGTAVYAILASDASGNDSALSSNVTATFADNVAPATPAGLAVTSANGDDATGTYTVILNWTANAESDFATYEVFRDGSSIGTTAANTFSDVLAGETAGNTHDYTLTATDATGNTSTATSAVTATLTDNVAPAVPTGLTVTSANGDDASGNYFVVLDWTANAEADIQGYRVFRDGVAVGTPTTNTFTDILAGDTAGSTYTYTVEAVDNSSNLSGQTAGVVATLVDNTAPAVPTGFAAANGPNAGEITLTWNANSESDLQGYGVFGGDTSGTYNLAGSPVAQGAASTSYTWTGLTTGTTYYFTILAQDASGNQSAQATEISFVAP